MARETDRSSYRKLEKGIEAEMVLLALPLIFVAVSLVLRAHGGPFWMWHLVDPSYFYLFDAVNLANLEWPGHPYHPGTPVQVLGALVLRIAYPTLSAGELADRVMDDPEAALALIGTVIVVLEGGMLYAAGRVVWHLTRRLPMALFMEAAPFLSMVTLKNAYHVKPEPMLVVVALALSMVTLLALRPGVLDGNRSRFAVAFGLVAGFGVATKLTAAPVFLLPLFLLGRWRAVLIYGAVAAAAFGLFTLPAWGSFHKFFSFAAMTMASSGAYGGGEGAFIDLAVYPKAALKIFKRPVILVPVLLALIALGVAWSRRRKGLPVPGPEVRGLAGLALAITAHVLAVAKQPTANYMVPSYMLAPLGVVLLWRYVAAMEWGGDVFRRRAGNAVGILLIVGIVAQGFSVARLDRELQEKHAFARSLDEAAFEGCARIDFFPPSTPAFALHLGDWWTGSRHQDRVAAQVPNGTFWYEQNTGELRDANGPVDVTKVLADFPCTRFRGGHIGPISEHVASRVPNIQWTDRCGVGSEWVMTIGTTCADKIIQTEP